MIKIRTTIKTIKTPANCYFLCKEKNIYCLPASNVHYHDNCMSYISHISRSHGSIIIEISIHK